MLFHPFKNNRGLALIFMVLLFTAAATASVMFISLGVKVKGIQKEGTTQQRLTEIRTALQNYYLIQYDLPDPSLTTPANTVPTVLLNLPQKYRFDSNGQRIWYDRLPANGHMINVRNVSVHGTNPENEVAAVLVAPGPDKSIAPDNLASPYDDPANPANDDIVLAVSLEAEALKIANHTVAVLQQAARAYDSIFYGKNNDIDTLYYPPEGTQWVDNTPPIQAYEYNPNLAGNYIWDIDRYRPIQEIDPGPPPVWETATHDRTAGWYPNYAGELHYTRNANDGRVIFTPGNLVPDDDESIQPYDVDGDGFFVPQPESIIDEDGYTPAQGGVDGNTPSGSGCVRIADVGSGILLANDPDRGVATLDDCRHQITGDPRDPAYDLALAYGLNLVKLGYDATSGSLLDPWNNPYRWGVGDPAQSSSSAQDQARDRHFWTFYSTGPDGTDNTPDDILPPADRIPGYFLTPSIANPIP